MKSPTANRIRNPTCAAPSCWRSPPKTASPSRIPEPGLESAAAAGAVCIGVPLHVALPDDSPYTLWHTLAGKGLADLAEVFRSARTLESGIR